MAIRAFLTNWTLVNGVITNPIVEHLDTQPDMGIIPSMIYGDADGNGLPDKPVAMVIVESGQVEGHMLETLKNVEGVTLIPGQRPDKTMAKLPPSVAGDIDGLASQFGIPRSVITGATTYDQFLIGLAKHINQNTTALDRYISKRPLEFG